MTAGFRAHTSDGWIQIDGTTPNYQVVLNVVQTLTQASLATVYNNVGTQFYATFWHTSFSFTASNPFFAFIGQSGFFVTPWKFTNNGGNNYTAEFVGSGACTVRLVVFDQVAPSSSRAGLRVWDTTGRLLVDAGNPFARVLDVISGQYLAGTGFDGSGTSHPPTGTLTASYGANIAIAGCFPAFYIYGDGTTNGGPGEVTMSGFNVSGGSVTYEFHTFSGSVSSHFIGFREATAYRFMVLDMTGII